MIKYAIYLVTHKPTNKYYIGYTSRKLYNRKAGHYSRMRSGSKTKFHNALRKYPKDEFEWKIIYESNEDCLHLEDAFIVQYDSLNKGFNSCKGGGDFPRMKGVNHPLFGKPRTDTEKTKISENHANVSGVRNPRFDNTNYTFKHTSGLVFIGTRYDFYTKYSLNKGNIHTLISNPKHKTCKGWSLT